MNPKNDADPSNRTDDPASSYPPFSDGATSVDEAMSQADDGDQYKDRESRDETLDRLRREVDEANGRALKAQAELENFRRRLRSDYEDQLRFASLPLVSDILQVRDNLVRALEAVAATGSIEGLRDGVAIVVKQFDDILGKYSVTPIEAIGQAFDPNVHQAISQMSSDTHPEGVVAHVAVTGFLMHDRVVRPSQVVVSTGAGGG